MSNFKHRCDPELSEYLETMKALEQGPSEVLAEAPSETLWKAISEEALSSTEFASDPVDGLGPQATQPVPLRSGTKSRYRLLLLSGGVAAVCTLLILLPLGLAWRSSQETPANFVAQLDRLGDFQGDGSATLRGSSLEVNVTPLPPSVDATYELWLLDLNGDEIRDLTSLGPIDSSAQFAVPEGIDPRRYSVVDVSVEPNDGDPAHSGASVLQGELLSS